MFGIARVSPRRCRLENQGTPQDDFVFDAVGAHQEPGAGRALDLSGCGDEKGIEEEVISGRAALRAVHREADEG